jgi:glycine cleavage system transcriptional repressor
MTDRYIMTAFGKDRVGIVADVTRVLYENDCNLEDTTMNLLADEFTLNLLFSANTPDIEEQLSSDCRRLELEKGIAAFVRKITPTEAKKEKEYKTCNLHIEGLDQGGIVYKTSKFLAQNNLNIIQLNSAAKASPQSGAIMYIMDIMVEMGKGITLDQVEDDLNAMADELQVDIRMSC